MMWEKNHGVDKLIMAHERNSNMWDDLVRNTPSLSPITVKSTTKAVEKDVGNGGRLT